MEIATIVPSNYLHLVKDDYYHLCLAHLIGKDEEYTLFYQDMKCGPDSKFIIMDNGVAEGETLDIEEIYYKASVVMADELVLPDVFLDGPATVKSSLAALNLLEEFNYKGRIMAVPQGCDYDEWLRCATTLLKDGRIHTLGIPKNLVKLKGNLGRLRAIMDLNLIRMIDNVSIHLLGCWTDPREVGMIYRNIRSVSPGVTIRGVDSGIATIYAQEGLPLIPDKHPKPKRIVDFAGKDLDEDLLYQNINIWKRCCFGELC